MLSGRKSVQTEEESRRECNMILVCFQRYFVFRRTYVLAGMRRCYTDSQGQGIKIVILFLNFESEVALRPKILDLVPDVDQLVSDHQWTQMKAE